MPEKYLILRQEGKNCEVVLYDSNKQTREVLFSGKRWPARHFIHDLLSGIAWENVPAFCEKKGRNGFPGKIIQINRNQL